ncbi:hypothetical protein [Halotalea alkalilenta]|uniref:hypothetical protein n=1 Tax=Halotalea alkalilenta TaxID=376489 RepID=UPI000A4DE71B|nr:hypothetical protein [Halotalea alkalilenta]
MNVSAQYRYDKRRWPRRLSCLLPLLCYQADSSLAAVDNLQIHGFLSQTLLYTDRNHFFGADGNLSADYTELGLNASLRPSSRMLVAAQVLARRVGDSASDGAPKLDYGVIDYQPYTSASANAGFQIGRGKLPLGIYNQTRDVAFTRPGILLPQSIYFDRTRNLGLAADGVMTYVERRLSNGTLRFNLGVGVPLKDDDVERALGIQGHPTRIDTKASMISQLQYEHDGGRIIAALSTARVKADIDEMGGRRTDGEFDFQPIIFSAQYNAEHWNLTMEYALRKREFSGLSNPALNSKVTGESAYLQYTRLLNEDWRWLLRYDLAISDRNDRWGYRQSEVSGSPAYSAYARDWTTGLQWSVSPRLLLAAEYHYVTGTFWLTDRDDASKRWNLLLMQMTLRF